MHTHKAIVEAIKAAYLYLTSYYLFIYMPVIVYAAFIAW